MNLALGMLFTFAAIITWGIHPLLSFALCFPAGGFMLKVSAKDEDQFWGMMVMFTLVAGVLAVFVGILQDFNR